MILEWIRFGVSAVLMITGLCFLASAVIGAYRFGFVMNRMHAAGIFFVILSVAVASGSVMDALKLMLLVFFMWFTSPVATHFLGQVEYYTNPVLHKYLSRLWREDEEEGGADASD